MRWVANDGYSKGNNLSQLHSIRGMRAASSAALLCVLSACASNYQGVAPQNADLSGRWRLNVALSEDAEALLQHHLNQDSRREANRELRAMRASGSMLPPPESPQANSDAPPPRISNSRRTAQERHMNTLRRMLGISRILTITQAGANLQIVSEVDSRSFEAGTHSQVSMPLGDLADSAVGWEGEWFVIDRRVSGGARVVEKYRRLKPTDQLESLMAWSGDGPLSGVKVRRVYDRVEGALPPPDPGHGPVK